MGGRPTSSPRVSAPPAREAVDTGVSALAAFCALRGVESQLPPPTDCPDERAPRALLCQPVSLGGALGSGGSGRVVSAYDQDLRRTVALKLLHPRVLEDPMQVQAFLEEAVITGGLEHPNIVPIHSLGYSPEWGPYYTMKRLRGRPLNNILRGLRMDDPDIGPRFHLSRLLGCFIEVCQAVAFAHDQGVIHCDIKPSNIMIGDYGEVMVVDWGLARLLGARGRQQARSALWSGTPAYMPPEQLTGTLTDLDVQTDVWALGAVLYELLTLSVPFVAEQTEDTMRKLLTEPIEPPTSRAPERGIPDELEKICLRALERDRRRRYQSVQSMLRDVDAYLEGSREAKRRAEHSQRALEQAQRQLSRLRTAEQALDELLRGQAPPTPQLFAAQDDLILAYANAAAILDRALKLDAQDGALQAAAGDLYWRVFLRIYPGMVRASGAVRERGAEVLSVLSQRALAAIVQAGRTQDGLRARRQSSTQIPALKLPAEADKGATSTTSGEATSAEAATDDLWLTAVLRLCGEPVAGDNGQGLWDGGQALPSGLTQVVAKIRLLKSVSIFAAVPAFELLAVAEACDTLHYEPRAVIFRKDEPGDALFLVAAGEVAIVRDGVTLTTLGKMTCFGEVAVLDGSTRTADAVCVGPTQVLRLTASRFKQIIAQHGEIGLSVIAVLTQRLRHATDREASLRNSIKLSL
jgi:hypothetical protein